MPRVLLQSVAVTLRSLAEAGIALAHGTFPGAATYPGGGSGGTYPGAAIYPGATLFPGSGGFLFPGKGNSLASTPALSNTLTETTA